MKKGKKEVSDGVVFILLIIAFVVAALGGYIVYDYSHSYGSNEERITVDRTAGMVTLNVIERDEVQEKEIDNENIQ